MRLGRFRPQQNAVGATVLVLALVILACGGGTLIVANATVTMSQVSNSTTIAAGTSGSIGATCPAGTQMTSGGYYVQGTPQRFVATSSYPIALDTWIVTATALADGPISLPAYANCLHASFSIGERIASLDWNAPAQAESVQDAQCPAGTSVTSSGYALRVSSAYLISAFPSNLSASGDQTTPYGALAA